MHFARPTLSGDTKAETERSTVRCVRHGGVGNPASSCNSDLGRLDVMAHWRLQTRCRAAINRISSRKQLRVSPARKPAHGHGTSFTNIARVPNRYTRSYFRAYGNQHFGCNRDGTSNRVGGHIRVGEQFHQTTNVTGMLVPRSSHCGRKAWANGRRARGQCHQRSRPRTVLATQS